MKKTATEPPEFRAFRKFMGALVAVPKEEIDRKLAREKAKPKRSRSK